MSVLPQHIKIEPYCIFCRETLPFGATSSTRRGEPEAVELWNRDTLCFFSYIHSGGNLSSEQRHVAFRTDIASEWSHSHPETPLQNLGLPDELHLCGGIVCSFRKCDPRNATIFCHVVCYQLAKTKLPELNQRKIRRIAQHLRPLFLWDSASKLANVELRPDPPSPSDVCGQTALEALLLEVRNKLPLELSQAVLGYNDGMTGALVRCLTTLEYIGKNGSLPEHFERITRLFAQRHTTVKAIVAKTVDILGEQCLCSIEGKDSSAEDFGDQTSVLVFSKKVQGLQIAFGTYGLVDLRLIYSDGSLSQWIGCQRRRRVATYRDTELALLRVATEGAKIIDIFSIYGPSRHLLWDREGMVPLGTTASCIRLEDPGNVVRAGNRYRLAQYLPLGEATSLTIFCSLSGVCGIQVNDDRTMRIGSQFPEHCCVTSYLHDGEWITSLYVLVQGREDMPFAPPGPHLLVITSMERHLFFGPYMLADLPNLQISHFGRPRLTRIRGLFTDPGSYAVSMRLGSIGVHFDDDPTSQGPEAGFIVLPDPSPSRPTSFTHRYPHLVFLSHTDFRNVKTIILQRQGPRCVGLKIIRHSGLIDVLGQWEPSDRASTTTLFDCDQQQLDALTFVFEEGSPAKTGLYPWLDLKDFYVTEVFVGFRLAEPLLGTSFTWSDLDQELAWYFSPKHDHLEAWDGSICEFDIPPKSFLQSTIIA